MPNTTNSQVRYMTFNELLMDAIKFDEPHMAYAIFWLIKHEVYKGTDRADNVNWDLVDLVS